MLPLLKCFTVPSCFALCVRDNKNSDNNNNIGSDKPEEIPTFLPRNKWEFMAGHVPFVP